MPLTNEAQHYRRAVYCETLQYKIYSPVHDQLKTNIRIFYRTAACIYPLVIKIAFGLVNLSLLQIEIKFMHYVCTCIINAYTSLRMHRGYSFNLTNMSIKMSIIITVVQIKCLKFKIIQDNLFSLQKVNQKRSYNKYSSIICPHFKNWFKQAFNKILFL